VVFVSLFPHLRYLATGVLLKISSRRFSSSSGCFPSLFGRRFVLSYIFRTLKRILTPTCPAVHWRSLLGFPFWCHCWCVLAYLILSSWPSLGKMDLMRWHLYCRLLRGGAPSMPSCMLRRPRVVQMHITRVCSNHVSVNRTHVFFSVHPALKSELSGFAHRLLRQVLTERISSIHVHGAIPKRPPIT
jgi:hypothetical protein